jgi:hypothetical protein
MHRTWSGAGHVGVARDHMADALLSDIDGTLVDNNALYADACRQIGKGGDQVAKASKPEADSFAATLEKVMMRAGQGVALGDAPWDAQAAGKLGIPVIGLTSGDWKADDLRRVCGRLGVGTGGRCCGRGDRSHRSLLPTLLVEDHCPRGYGKDVQECRG